MASGMEEKTVGLSRADSTNSNKLGTVMSGTNAAVAQQYGETQRGLSPRHVQLMAIGGSIGTGLWVGLLTALRCLRFAAQLSRDSNTF